MPSAWPPSSRSGMVLPSNSSALGKQRGPPGPARPPDYTPFRAANKSSATAERAVPGRRLQAEEPDCGQVLCLPALGTAPSRLRSRAPRPGCALHTALPWYPSCYWPRAQVSRWPEEEGNLTVPGSSWGSRDGHAQGTGGCIIHFLSSAPTVRRAPCWALGVER